MNTLQLSSIRRTTALPAKTRETKDSALALQMKKLTKVGHSFVVEGKELPQVAPTIYATAKRIGVEVTLRSEKDDKGNLVGVGVYLKTPLANPINNAKPGRRAA